MRDTILPVSTFTIHKVACVWGITRLGIHFLNKNVDKWKLNMKVQKGICRKNE